VAIKRNDLRLEMIPGPETRIEPDDLLVVIGESDSLKRLTTNVAFRYRLLEIVSLPTWTIRRAFPLL
jgi:uncharacterized protein with PhoU and TrkA domain